MDYLKGHNLVTVDQLVAATDASPATIRRDPARQPRLLKRVTPWCSMRAPP